MPPNGRLQRSDIPRYLGGGSPRKQTYSNGLEETRNGRRTREKNKALVLKAFDTLFNKRDYAAAERFWSPHYIQHSAHIAPGREGLFNLIKSIPPTLKYERE